MATFWKELFIQFTVCVLYVSVYFVNLIVCHFGTVVLISQFLDDFLIIFYFHTSTDLI